MPPKKPTIAQLPPAAQSLVGRWRLVLGKDALTGGKPNKVSFTVDMPGDLTWYPTPAALPT